MGAGSRGPDVAARARVDALARGRAWAEEEARSRVIHNRRRDPREVPRARDPGAERPGPGACHLRGLPPRERDARSGLWTSPGGHLHVEAGRDLIGDRGGSRVLWTSRQRADEELQTALD